MATSIQTPSRQIEESTPAPDVQISAMDYLGFDDVPRRNFMQEFLEVPAMVVAMGLPQNQRMLEIGCGPGIALPPLSRLCKPKRLAAIDVDDRLIQSAKQRLQQRRVDAELRAHDVRKLPFPDASFDVIIDFGTCYHVSHRLKALKEIARVLTVGGIFVYETRINQFLSHPIRSYGRTLPWHLVHNMKFRSWAVMWASRVKIE